MSKPATAMGSSPTSQYGEAAADVVGDDEGLVALLGGEAAQGALSLVRDGDDTLTSGLLTDLLL